MRNVPEICIRETSDSVIKFQEKRSSLRFSNIQKGKAGVQKQVQF